MIRIAKETDPKRLLELKEKIHDRKYLDIAIQKIARTLSEELLQLKEEKR